LIGCKPAASDVSPLVDRRLRELGLAPSALASARIPSTPVAPPPTRDPLVDSLRLLARLDQLMDDFGPAIPSAPDPSDVMRCVTTLALQKDEKLKGAQQKIESKRESLAKERQKRVRAVYGLSLRCDLDWATKKRIEPPIYGCCDEDGSNCERWPAGAQSCAYEGGLWRI